MILGWADAYPALRLGFIGLLTAVQGEAGVIVSLFLVRAGQMSWITYILTIGFAITIYESAVYGLGRILRGTRVGNSFGF